jgi:16S rRNA processing protein RimM
MVNNVPTSKPDYLAIAEIVAPHGIRGEVRAQILTEFPERFALLEEVYLGQEGRKVGLESHRLHKGQVLLKLAGCDTRNDAEELRKLLVQVPLDQAMPLPEDAYYLYEIVGLKVWTDDGEYLGMVEDVIETGANDVYVVRGPGLPEILLPAIDDVILKVDPQEEQMLVKLLPGLR